MKYLCPSKQLTDFNVLIGSSWKTTSENWNNRTRKRGKQTSLVFENI